MTLNIINEELIIRNAVKSDAKALVEYFNVTAGESDFFTFGMGQYDKSVEQEEEIIEEALRKENELLIVAEANNKVIGCLIFRGGPRQRNAHTGELGVSVIKECWGLGIGKQLIEYLINWSRTCGMIRKINLKVRVDNTRGIHLYKKLGFVEEGVIKREFLINGEFYDSLFMGLLVD